MSSFPDPLKTLPDTCTEPPHHPLVFLTSGRTFTTCGTMSVTCAVTPQSCKAGLTSREPQMNVQSIHNATFAAQLNETGGAELLARARDLAKCVFGHGSASLGADADA